MNEYGLVVTAFGASGNGRRFFLSHLHLTDIIVTVLLLEDRCYLFLLSVLFFAAFQFTRSIGCSICCFPYLLGLAHAVYFPWDIEEFVLFFFQTTDLSYCVHIHQLLFPEVDIGLLQRPMLELFVIIVDGFQPLIIITKSSTLDVAAVLDPPLVLLLITTQIEESVPF